MKSTVSHLVLKPESFISTVLIIKICHAWQIVFYLTALVIVQAFPAVPQGILNASPSKKNFSDAFRSPSKRGDLIMTNAFISLDKALKSLIPDLPALTNALTHLTEDLPRFSAMLSRFVDPLPTDVTTNNPSYPEVPQEIFDTVREFYPALNELFEHVEPVFPVFANILLILTKELPYLTKTHPALAQHVSAFAGLSSLSHPKPRDTLPALERAIPVFYESVPEWKKKPGSALFADFDGSLKTGLPHEPSLESNPSYYSSPSYYPGPSYYSNPSYYSSSPTPIIIVPMATIY